VALVTFLSESTRPKKGLRGFGNQSAV
jgi:hypothetical protein